MASFVRISGDQVEFPHLSIKYPLRPPSADLQAGLEAYRELQSDPSLQSLPLEQRREVTRFLRQFGQLLFRSVFPDDTYARLDGPAPLLLELENEWRSYPWELLHDGSHWVSLHRGLLRFAAPPAAGEPEPPPLVGPLRVVAVSAAPLSVEPEEEFSIAVDGAGRRFISTVGQLLEQPEGEAPPFLFRSLEHASRDALEEAVILAPHLLFFSGFAAQQGWFLESDSLGPDQVGREWLTAHLHKATRGGLRALVLKDSLALSRPDEATEQAAAFFRAGLPALVRIEGRQVRAREQDYFRTLVQNLAGGGSVVEGHLAGVRRMYRRFEESWDWSFNRLYLKALPRNGTAPDAPPAPASAPARIKETAGEDSAVPETARHFLLRPPPPLFQRNRRVFGRHRELDRLAAALHPEHSAPSPLVFLCGPAGSGKTALAFETARRVQRRFGQVAYLHRRDLPGEREGLALPPGLVPPEPPPAERLFAALARQVGLRSSSDDAAGEALRLRLGEGPPSLIVVDGLENQSGYLAFCQALEKFPANCRILLLSRAKPPLLAGSQVYLAPLEPVELEEVFDVSLPRKIAEYPFREGLERACRRDLLLSRLMWRLDRWPSAGRIAATLPEGEGESEEAPPAGNARLLALALEAVLAEVSREALRVLEALSLFTFLVHREVLTALAGLETRTLSRVLAELQWKGLLEGYGGETFCSLHPRIQNLVARRLVTAPVFFRLRPLLLRAYQSYLAGLEGEPAGDGGTRTRWEPSAWREESCDPDEIPRARRLHRLGVERTNLMELGMILFDEKDWRNLTRLVGAAAFLGRMPAMADLTAFLHWLLLSAGVEQKNATLQATALNALAKPFLAQGQAREALALLEKALELIGNSPGWKVLLETYLNLSRCHDLLGNREPALNLLFAAIELGRQTESTGFLVQSAEALAGLFREGEEARGEGRRRVREILQFLVERDHPLPAARVRRVLGDISLAAGRPEEARDLYLAISETFHKAGDHADIYLTLIRLAKTFVAEENPDEALDRFRQAKQLPGGHEEPEEEQRILSRICQLYEQSNRRAEALQGYLQIRKIHEELGDREGLIGVLDILGGLYFQLGEQAQSTRCYEERLQLQAALPTT